MNIVRCLLLALLLTPPANAAQTQNKETRDKANSIRQADPPRAQSPTASERARQRRSAEESARAERSPPAPRSSKLP